MLSLERADNAQLVAAVQAGGAAAFTALYERHIGRVNAYLRAALRDESDVQDAAQLVFTAVFAAIPSYRSTDAGFDNWLMRIVRNKAIDYARTRHRTSPQDPQDLNRYLAELEHHQPMPPAAWRANGRLHEALQALPLPQREVLVLHYLLGLSAVEIAEGCDCSAGTVRQRHRRALQTLGLKLADHGRLAA